MDEAQPNDDLNSMFHDLVSHLSVDSDNELQSNYSVEQAEPAESYISMFLNVNGGPSIEFVNAYQLDLTVADECVDTTPIEILLNPTDQITPIPFINTFFPSCPHTYLSSLILTSNHQFRWYRLKYHKLVVL